MWNFHRILPARYEFAGRRNWTSCGRRKRTRNSKSGLHRKSVVVDRARLSAPYPYRGSLPYPVVVDRARLSAPYSYRGSYPYSALISLYVVPVPENSTGLIESSNTEKDWSAEAKEAVKADYMLKWVLAPSVERGDYACV